MGIFNGVVICLDFDGTMAYRGKVSKENGEAIAYFQSEGGIFCPCSGRRAHFFHECADIFRPNGPVVALNGSVILEYGATRAEDRVVYESIIPLDLAKDFARDAVRIAGVKSIFLHHVEGPAKLIPDGKRDMDTEIDALTDDFRKIAVLHYPEAIDALRATLEPKYADRMFFSSSDSEIYETQMIGGDKGSSALRVKEMLGAHTLVCAGDYGNDIPMLKIADIAYATGNAIDSVKAIAHRVTVPCTEHAIRAIVEDLKRDFS